MPMLPPSGMTPGNLTPGTLSSGGMTPGGLTSGGMTPSQGGMTPQMTPTHLGLMPPSVSSVSSVGKCTALILTCKLNVLHYFVTLIYVMCLGTVGQSPMYPNPMSVAPFTPGGPATPATPSRPDLSGIQPQLQ